MNGAAQLSRPAVAASPAREGTGMQGPGVFFLLVFLFLAFSRLTDVLVPGLYLPLIVSVLALCIAVATGGLQRALGSRAGFWLIAFSLWLVAATPFSFWPGGSVQFLWEVWLKSLLVFVLVAGLLRTVRHCWLALLTIAYASVTIVVMCFFLGTTSREGRLVIEPGVLSNPNDLAQLLLMGIPVLLLIVMTNRQFLLKRVIAGLALGGLLIATGATGSRGALAALLSMTLLTFLSFSWGNRLKLLAVLAVAVPLALTYMSAEQRNRYLTVLAGESTDEASTAVDEAAIASTAARMGLLRQSLEMTATHPLLGIGPGVFQAAAAADSADKGTVAMWRETHNAYTQISSEAGVPALICYLAALFVCVTKVRAIYRTARERSMPQIADASYGLWLTLISFAVTALFSSVAYQIYLPTLAGLSVALGRAVQADFDAPRQAAG